MHEHFDSRGLGRDGGTRTIFTIHCHKCDNHEDWTFNKRLAFEPVAKKFQEHGWVIGRNRRHDLCPACVGVTPAHKLARKFNVVENGAPVPSPAELARNVGDSRRRVSAKTSEMIERVFGKPAQATPPPEPSPVQLPVPVPEIVMTPALPETVSIPSPAPVLQSDVVAELSNLRAAVELLLDSNTQLISAVANIVPALVRSNQALGDRVVQAIENIPQTPPVVIPEPSLDAAAAVQALRAVMGETVSTTPEVIKKSAPPPKAAARTVRAVVRSYQSSRDGSYSTVLRFERDAFEALGFDPQGRFQIRRSGRRLLIRQDPRGVKVMRVNSCSVVLQSTSLGDVARWFGTNDLDGVLQGNALALHPAEALEKVA